MKSPSTLIKLHQRAIRIQEMIEIADRRAKSNMADARKFKKFAYSNPIKWYVERARRNNHIAIYLRKRYANLLTNKIAV